MKIITGSLRGRNLAAPKGTATRPTTGRIKESIFNIIQFDVEGRKVFDMFAGSGQMGLEAISRGAESCTFCETDRGAFQTLTENIEGCGVTNAQAFQRDGVSHGKSVGQGAFGLIFIDPPYGTKLANTALISIFEFDILQEGGIIVCEGDEEDTLPEIPHPYVLLKEYNYSRTKITTITRQKL